MPTDGFLDTLLPLNAKHPKAPDAARDYFHGIPLGTTRKVMCAPLMTRVNGNQNRPTLIPGFKFVDSSNHPDAFSSAGKKIRPDLLMHPTDVETGGPMQFDKTEMVIELKARNTCDGFPDPKGGTTNMQPRWLHANTGHVALSSTVGGNGARFIRHGRSAIVSRSFNYKEEPKTLVNFFWRCAHAQDGVRGIDNTLRLATQAEQSMTRDLLETRKPDVERSLIVLQVPSTHGTPAPAGSPTEWREFIAWGSVANAYSLTGRATRAWPIVDVKTKRVMPSKDS
ncbi:hypothetical protein BD779DRAFT_1789514 [Infundibulicybe gibba]|nr:hypothetical protein BD779DRAFT_1789514 [Infundibulicybe gibba]